MVMGRRADLILDHFQRAFRIRIEQSDLKFPRLHLKADWQSALRSEDLQRDGNGSSRRFDSRSFPTRLPNPHRAIRSEVSTVAPKGRLAICPTFGRFAARW